MLPEEEREVMLTVSQQRVFNEVARKSAYIGGKTVPNEKDPDVYDRVAVVDEDSPELEVFWDEATVDLANALQSRMVREGFHEEQEPEPTPDDDNNEEEPEEPTEEHSDQYEVVLSVWQDFEDKMLPTMNKQLYAYFVAAILAKWCMLIHHTDVEYYGALALSHLDELRSNCYRKIFERKQNPF